MGGCLVFEDVESGERVPVDVRHDDFVAVDNSNLLISLDRR